MNKKTTAEEIVKILDEKIAHNQVKDAVHKIKFMTAREVIIELMRE
ncbi:MAG: hypothetical protein ACPH63_07970 [Flavobacteriaceae bacterium]